MLHTGKLLEAVGNIDYSEFVKQKHMFLELIESDRLTDEQKEMMTGLLGVLDGVTDYYEDSKVRITAGYEIKYRKRWGSEIGDWKTGVVEVIQDKNEREFLSMELSIVLDESWGIKVAIVGDGWAHGVDVKPLGDF